MQKGLGPSRLPRLLQGHTIHRHNTSNHPARRTSHQEYQPSFPRTVLHSPPAMPRIHLPVKDILITASQDTQCLVHRPCPRSSVHSLNMDPRHRIPAQCLTSQEPARARTNRAPVLRHSNPTNQPRDLINLRRNLKVHLINQITHRRPSDQALILPIDSHERTTRLSELVSKTSIRRRRR